MKQLIPYLNFNGQCRQALAFYQACFGEDNVEVSIRTFADAPVDDMPEDVKESVMHAEFKSHGLFFMASDGNRGMPFEQGNNIHLNMQLTNVDEQTELFEKMSAGGQVTMPLQDTFWQSRFGMLTDKFGIQWMMNVPLE